jgi:hypothetical protein
VVKPQAGLEVLPQAALVPATPGFPHLYVQLMQNITKDPMMREESLDPPLMREESQSSSPTVQD